MGHSCLTARPVVTSASGEGAAATVFLLDADAAVRDAVAAALQTDGMDVRVYAHAAPFLAAELPPGPLCLVIDRDLPPEGGIAVLRKLEARGEHPAVVVTSGRLNPTLTEDVQQLLKPFGQNELIVAIGLAMAARGDPNDT